MNAIFYILHAVLDVYWWVVVISLILSWMVAFNMINMAQPFLRTVFETCTMLTEPVYRPIRAFLGRILPPGIPVDLSPVVVLILLQALHVLLWDIQSNFY